MSARPLPPTSRRLPNKILILLSGEPSTLPEAEARALLLLYDPSAVVERVEPRVLIAETSSSPGPIEARIAFARRVGELVEGTNLDKRVRRILSRGTFGLRRFTLGKEHRDVGELERLLLSQVEGEVDLKSPDHELSVVAGNHTYVALTRPALMKQGWRSRRPRARPFFHPTAIFPKLARALVNLSGLKEGQVLLDPFAGTGSILLEAAVAGLLPVGLDIDKAMAKGALLNQGEFSQSWLGLIHADAGYVPLKKVDGIVTDVPYGRTSSAYGKKTDAIVGQLLNDSAKLLQRGGLMVVMHPDTSRVGDSSHFAVEGAHHLYIHSKLTRVVTVLRRV